VNSDSKLFGLIPNVSQKSNLSEIEYGGTQKAGRTGNRGLVPVQESRRFYESKKEVIGFLE
jgi:hypothetical protein